jgi:hypothetical protein
VPRPKTFSNDTKAELVGARPRQKHTGTPAIHRGSWRHAQKALAERRKPITRQGFLAAIHGDKARLQVCKSAAGYYLGTKGKGGEPNSRESAEYWPKRWQARAALQGRRHWTQRLQP